MNCPHYQEERPHQWLGNELIAPKTTVIGAGHVKCRERIGGLLKFSYREAAGNPWPEWATATAASRRPVADSLGDRRGPRRRGRDGRLPHGRDQAARAARIAPVTFADRAAQGSSPLPSRCCPPRRPPGLRSCRGGRWRCPAGSPAAARLRPRCSRPTRAPRWCAR